MNWMEEKGTVLFFSSKYLILHQESNWMISMMSGWSFPLMNTRSSEISSLFGLSRNVILSRLYWNSIGLSSKVIEYLDDEVSLLIFSISSVISLSSLLSIMQYSRQSMGSSIAWEVSIDGYIWWLMLQHGPAYFCYSKAL